MKVGFAISTVQVSPRVFSESRIWTYEKQSYEKRLNKAINDLV